MAKQTKIVFQHDDGKYLCSYEHEDGGNCELSSDIDDATLFPKDFNALQEMLEMSDDYDPGNPEWDYTKFKPINIEVEVFRPLTLRKQKNK
jgi:hypothetical protein